MTHQPDAIYLTDVDYEYPEYPWWSGSTSEDSGGVKYVRADLVAALVVAATPYVSPVQNADYARQLRHHDALVAALAAMKGGAE